jgi:flagellar biosynthesis/type III secretory pathway protein FliH
LATRKTVIEDEFGIPMYERLSDEVDEIMNLSKGVMEKGMERGYEKGLEQGLAKGRELGIKKGIEQGIAEGVEQGIAEGIEQGIKQGKAQQTQLIALLADELAKADRSDELVLALHDEALLARLLKEFGIVQ